MRDGIHRELLNSLYASISVCAIRPRCEDVCVKLLSLTWVGEPILNLLVTLGLVGLPVYRSVCPKAGLCMSVSKSPIDP
jgi:hypothetical protein